MYHANTWQCSSCGIEIEIDAPFDVGRCHCGGRYGQSGECYDQEFVDQEQYYQEQDEEYERRHWYDGY